jgi:uncharacterized protein
MKYLGVGVGLRRQHFEDVLELDHQVDFFELLSENFMNYGGHPRKVITSLRQKNIPMIAHGVGLSLGSTDELDSEYVKSLKELLQFTQAPWFSDHLSFASENKIHFHDLIPVLRTDEAVRFISDKIKKIQDIFQRPFAIENVSYYAESDHHTMSETDFINELVNITDCSILLDVNNVFVNASNHLFDAKEYIDAIPMNKVIQLHIAGHFDRGDMILDTHGDFITDSVWDLYRYTLNVAKTKISTLIEWDNDIPNFRTLESEAIKAKNIMSEVLSEVSGGL